MMDSSLDDGAATFDACTDEELLEKVRDGDVGAFSGLYHRHVVTAIDAARRLGGPGDPQDVAQEAFLKILAAVLRGGGPRNGFAGYLVRTVRNEVIDRARRAREGAVDDMEAISSADMAVPDGVDELFDRHLVKQAFSTLPHAWQEILWLTEVEGLPPRSLGPRLQQSPNAVAQLSRRAREGLRTAWLQAHVDSASADQGCRQTAASLGAYERGRLSASRAARLEAHLDRCENCTAALAELKQTSLQLRGLLLPVVLGSPVLLRELSDVLVIGGPAVHAEPGAGASGAEAGGVQGPAAEPAGGQGVTAAARGVRRLAGSGATAATTGVIAVAAAAVLVTALVITGPTSDDDARGPVADAAPADTRGAAEDPDEPSPAAEPTDGTPAEDDVSSGIALGGGGGSTTVPAARLPVAASTPTARRLESVQPGDAGLGRPDVAAPEVGAEQLPAPTLRPDDEEPEADAGMPAIPPGGDGAEPGTEPMSPEEPGKQPEPEKPGENPVPEDPAPVDPEPEDPAPGDPPPGEPGQDDPGTDPVVSAPEMTSPDGGRYALPVTLTGSATPGAVVYVHDRDGQEVGAATVADDGSWSVVPSPGAPGVGTAYRVLQDVDGTASEPGEWTDEYVFVAPDVLNPADGAEIPVNAFVLIGGERVAVIYPEYDLGEQQAFTVVLDGKRTDRDAGTAPAPMVLGRGAHTLEIAYLDRASGRLGAIRTVTFTVV